MEGAGVAERHTLFRSLDEAATQGPYRCITLWHVMEHVINPQEHLRRLRSMLSDDGILLLAVPDFGGLQARVFGRHWLHLDVPRHLYHFTRSGLEKLLETAGFHVVRISNQEIEYDWFGWMQSALNGVFKTPNILFDSLTGKSRRVSRLQIAASYVLSFLLAVPALALTSATSAIGYGGTLIVAARPHVDH